MMTLDHRYLRKVDCSSFVKSPPLALALPRVFLQWPLRVQTRQTRQAIRAFKQYFFLNMMSMFLTVTAVVVNTLL